MICWQIRMRTEANLWARPLRYLKNFWNQIFAYKMYGEYSIDNMAAEGDKTNHMSNERTACSSEA